MKILVISTVRFKLNGISSVIMNYYKAMNKEEIEMDIVSIDDPIEEYKRQFEQYSIHYFVIKKSKIFRYFFKLFAVAKAGNYEIVHVHGNSANMAIELLACWLAGIKVRIAHSHNTSSLHPGTHKLLYPLFSLLYTHGFACGQDAGRWLFHDKPFEVITNGIDLKKYNYDSKIRAIYREKIGAKDRIVIGHIGNFIEQKNHEFLINAFSDLIKRDNKYLLLLISDGYLLEPMKKKVQSLGLCDSVIFLGKTTEIQNYMLAMDMFVLPSLHEGLPVVLVEAQASGLPCLVADTVAKEADLTNSIKRLSIESEKIWVNQIMKLGTELLHRDRETISRDWKTLIRKAGYDINKNANYMRDLYFKYIAE